MLKPSEKRKRKKIKWVNDYIKCDNGGNGRWCRKSKEKDSVCTSFLINYMKTRFYYQGNRWGCGRRRSGRRVCRGRWCRRAHSTSFPGIFGCFRCLRTNLRIRIASSASNRYRKSPASAAGGGGGGEVKLRCIWILQSRKILIFVITSLFMCACVFFCESERERERLPEEERRKQQKKKERERLEVSIGGICGENRMLREYICIYIYAEKASASYFQIYDFRGSPLL